MTLASIAEVRFARPAWIATLLACATIASPLPASAVTMDKDRRGMAAGSFPATGLVRCTGSSGTAQLVGSQQVIVTAGHVLLGRAGPYAACTFTLIVNGTMRTVAIDSRQIRSGASNPLDAPASRDWAVARLESAMQGVRPYATSSISIGQDVRLVSGRTLGSGAPMLETCQIRGRVSGGGELAIDCSAQAGDSGAAIVTPDGRIGAIYVGFRSTSPGRSASFSTQHYNFALPIGGAMAAAIRELAR